MGEGVTEVYMADTSALVRRVGSPRVDDRFAELIGEGRISRCLLVDLELLRALAGGSVHRLRAGLDETLGRADVHAEDLDRAREVQERLAAAGRHHGTPAIDLVIAAVAERAGATLLHYDADFDRIAEVTGQPVEWVVPPGEAD
jgi:hypothetical protein